MSLRLNKLRYGGQYAPNVIMYIFGVFKNLSFITGCPKKGSNFDHFSSMSKILSINYKVTKAK